MEELNIATIENIIHIQEFMENHKLTLSTAESCTAGKLGSLLTRFDGASNFYNGGIICYQNYVKEQFLNVSPKTIETYDVVSREVAIEMVKGLVIRLNTDCGIAVTGYASKSNNPNIPNGTIYAAFNIKGNINTIELHLDKSRTENLSNACDAILKAFDDFLIYCQYST